MKNKRLIVAVLMLTAIFLSGCYSIDVDQTIHEDGSMDITIAYDFSAMMDMAAGMGDMSSDNSTDNTSEEFMAVCDDFVPEDFPTLSDATCTTTEDFVMTIAGTVPADSNTAFRVEGGSYIYDAKDIYNYVPDINMDDTSEESDTFDGMINDGSIKELAETKDMLDIGLTYTLTMPGEITESDLGTIEANTVTIDMFEMTEMDEVLVSAKAPGFELFGFGIYEIAIGGIILALIIVVIIIFIMKLGHNHGPHETDLESSIKESDMKSQPSENVRKLTAWLNQYSNTYSDDVLKRQMMNQGHPMNDIEEAFKRREKKEPSLPSDI